ncbi:MAG: GMC family oxidoreductase N-terminal domain-containing protein [Chloroflexota bacterium]|nr:GMC family oxidoreductase N-terminal domain-containing protein [Chloroflexota bacterium]
MENVDTIVIGAGSAGCVIASRLSEDRHHRVVLVEAGPDYGPVGAGRWPEPLLSARYQPGSHDWGYQMVARGRTYRQWRGKVVGGSSTINAAGITWPTRADLERWEALGNPGWGWAGLLPYLQRVERDRDGAWPGHGRDGLLPVTTGTSSSALIADLAGAYERHGVPRLADFNDPEAREGFGRETRNVLGARRVHLAEAYLDPARDRPNLTILSETIADRIVWRGDRADAVEVIRDGQRSRLAGERIVLCAGSFGTPAILQRSGIGPADRLRPLLEEGAPLHHLPGVGRNLWDQPGIFLRWEPAPGARERLMADGTPFAALVVKLKSDPALDWFDLHVFHSHLAIPGEGRFFGAQLWMLVPAESGEVLIASSDPLAPPRIRGGIGHPEDIARIAQGVRRLRAIIGEESLRSWIGEEAEPGARLDESALRAWVADHLDLYHHACGTAKLGPASDPLAVAEADGRVRGFRNLYLADASLIPVIPRAAVHLPVLALAEKIADELAGRGTAPPGYETAASS